MILWTVRERYFGLMVINTSVKFEQGNRHGQGTYHYRNGDVYEGEWISGKRNGNGKITYYAGGHFFGIWENDERRWGTYSNEKDEVFIGEVINDLPSSNGKYFDNEGNEKNLNI